MSRRRGNNEPKKEQFDDYDFQEPTVEYIDPPDHMGGPVLKDLTDAQLKEEVTCVLTADDPNQPKNLSLRNPQHVKPRKTPQKVKAEFRKKWLLENP